MASTKFSDIYTSLTGIEVPERSPRARQIPEIMSLEKSSSTDTNISDISTSSMNSIRRDDITNSVIMKKSPIIEKASLQRQIASPVILKTSMLGNQLGTFVSSPVKTILSSNTPMKMSEDMTFMSTPLDKLSEKGYQVKEKFSTDGLLYILAGDGTSEVIMEMEQYPDYSSDITLIKSEDISVKDSLKSGGSQMYEGTSGYAIVCTDGLCVMKKDSLQSSYTEQKYKYKDGLKTKYLKENSLYPVVKYNDWLSYPKETMDACQDGWMRLANMKLKQGVDKLNEISQHTKEHHERTCALLANITRCINHKIDQAKKAECVKQTYECVDPCVRNLPQNLYEYAKIVKFLDQIYSDIKTVAYSMDYVDKLYNLVCEEHSYLDTLECKITSACGCK